MLKSYECVCIVLDSVMKNNHTQNGFQNCNGVACDLVCQKEVTEGVFDLKYFSSNLVGIPLIREI